jgi:hypothetical protein
MTPVALSSVGRGGQAGARTAGPRGAASPTGPHYHGLAALVTLLWTRERMK